MQAATQIRDEAEQKAFDAYGKIIGITTELLATMSALKNPMTPIFPTRDTLFWLSRQMMTTRVF